MKKRKWTSPRRGRPTIPPERQLVAISASITPEQRTWLKAGAEKANMSSFSHYLRLVLANAMNRKNNH
jgi:hypothetical protein